jgi:hypothetical protein
VGGNFHRELANLGQLTLLMDGLRERFPGRDLPERLIEDLELRRKLYVPGYVRFMSAAAKSLFPGRTIVSVRGRITERDVPDPGENREGPPLVVFDTGWQAFDREVTTL